MYAAFFYFDYASQLFDLVIDGLSLICLAGGTLCQIFNRPVCVLYALRYVPKFFAEIFAAFIQGFSGMDHAAQHACQ